MAPAPALRPGPAWHPHLRYARALLGTPLLYVQPKRPHGRGNEGKGRRGRGRGSALPALWIEGDREHAARAALPCPRNESEGVRAAGTSVDVHAPVAPAGTSVNVAHAPVGMDRHRLRHRACLLPEGGWRRRRRPMHSATAFDPAGAAFPHAAAGAKAGRGPRRRDGTARPAAARGYGSHNTAGRRTGRLWPAPPWFERDTGVRERSGCTSARTRLRRDDDKPSSRITAAQAGVRHLWGRMRCRQGRPQ